MLTYKLREHTLLIEKGNTLKFPNNVDIEFSFCPSQAFGIVTGQGGRTVFKGDTPKLVFNANTGRQYSISSGTSMPLEVDIKSKSYEAKFEGNKFHILAHCPTYKEFIDFIETVYHGFPALLNLDFSDSPVIECTCGKIGDVSFTWQHKTVEGIFDVSTKEIQEQRVCDAWKRMTLLSSHPAKRRILAAIQYFYTACRLFEAGSSPSEFMAEIIHNYCKVLEVLFPPSGNGKTRDAAREGLRKLDYSVLEIERDFLPTMALRNEIDVGHVQLALFDQKQLNILHRYTDKAEGIFRSMLQRLLAKVDLGCDIIPKDPIENLDPKVANIIKKLAKYFPS